MFFVIRQLRKNEADRKQWQEEARKEWAEANARLERLFESNRTERERTIAIQERAAAQQERAISIQEQAWTQQEKAWAQQEKNQQLIADLLTQNLELGNRLLELLDRRNGPGHVSLN